MALNKLHEFFEEIFDKRKCYNGKEPELMLEDIRDELVKIYDSLSKEPKYQCNDMGSEWMDEKEMTLGIKLHYLISQINNLLKK